MCVCECVRVCMRAYMHVCMYVCMYVIIIIEFIVIPLHDDNDILHLYMMMMMTFNIYT